MSISRVFAAAATVATFTMTAANAQSLQNGLVPAEFPPSTYTGRQYVDSEGCVFIRAGIDGNVTWVPRVTRSRQVVCGLQPTFAQQAPKAVTAAPAARVEKPKKKPASRSVQPVQATPVSVDRQAACRGGNATSQRYVGRVGQGVRCGPQGGSFATSVGRNTGQTQAVRTRATAGQARVVPRHVYNKQATTGPKITIPDGYKPAWDDDRLNPNRAHQTLEGKAMMDQIWSETLPRKLLPGAKNKRVGGSETGEYVSVGSVSSTLTLSTRSKAPAAQGRVASHRYVQAGLFASETSARAAARKLAQLGVPVRMGHVTHKNTRYRAVFAGPFQTQAQLEQGFGQVTAAGYKNARLRK